MKAQAEDLLRSVPQGRAAAVTKAEPSASPPPGKGKGRGDGEEEAERRRESSAKERLARLHEKEEAVEMHSKTLELSGDVMKYLFTPPSLFRRFQDDFKCIIDGV